MSQADLPASLSGPGAPAAPPDEAPGFLARLAERFTAWAERWIPDAFVFALVATVLVVVAAYVTLLPKAGAAEAAVEVATIWGSGFWELLSFTLQMALIIITGYVVATTRPVFRLIVALAQVPKSLHPQPGREAPRRVGCGPPAAHPPACHRSASAGPRRLTQPPAPPRHRPSGPRPSRLTRAARPPRAGPPPRHHCKALIRPPTSWTTARFPALKFLFFFVMPDALVVYADPSLVATIMENLLGNAHKFSRGSSEPRIELGSTLKGGERYCFVKDNGAGFDMAHSARLFRPFERLHRQEEFPGTGIGLATVWRAVERHGGHLFAEAEPGHGATIYFRLDARGAALPPGVTAREGRLEGLRVTSRPE